MASPRKRAEPRSLSAELRRMSDTLDYFGVHDAEDVAAAAPAASPAEPDVAPTRDDAPPSPLARAQTAPAPPSAAPAEVPATVRDMPRPAASLAQSAPLPSPQLGATQQTLATYRRSQYRPVPSGRPRAVPSAGATWPSRLTDVLITTLSPYEFLVYHYLFVQSYGHGQLTYRCPRRDIAIATGLSEPTVRRALQALAAELSLVAVTELPRFVYEFSVLVPTEVLAAWNPVGSEQGDTP
jgi:hypothetical protein